MSYKYKAIRKGTVCAVCNTEVANTASNREYFHFNGLYDTPMCARCFEEAGLENEHQDGLHEEFNEDCPMCANGFEEEHVRGFHNEQANEDCPMCREAAPAEDSEWITIPASELQPGMVVEKGVIAARRVGKKWATGLNADMVCILYVPADSTIQVRR